jgi:hypothetical protein
MRWMMILCLVFSGCASFARYQENQIRKQIVKSVRYMEIKKNGRKFCVLTLGETGITWVPCRRENK